MYLASADFLFRRDHLFVVLSQFGSTAPSVINRGGTAITIEYIVEHTSESEGVTTIRKAPEHKFPNDAIYISQKSLEAAIEDMAEMLKRGIIMQDKKERARSARNLAYEGATLDGIWDFICATVKGEKGMRAGGTVAKALTAEQIKAKADREKKLEALVMQDI